MTLMWNNFNPIMFNSLSIAAGQERLLHLCRRSRFLANDNRGSSAKLIIQELIQKAAGKQPVKRGIESELNVRGRGYANFHLGCRVALSSEWMEPGSPSASPLSPQWTNQPAR